MPRRTFLLALLAAMTLALPFAPPARAAELTVFAASSLKGSLDDVAASFEARTGTTVVISYASSSQLARQIEAAAPADIFISADTAWMDYLVDRSAVKEEDVVDLLGNRLVLIAARDSTISLEIGRDFPLAAALGDGRLAMGDPSRVPAGKYARQALEFHRVWQDVETRLAGADNVRAALRLVSSGETPLGIVYETDAKADSDVRVVDTFGAESHAPIVYPAAPVLSSTNPEKHAFMGFLTGPDAAAIFRKAGFTVLAPS